MTLPTSPAPAPVGDPRRKVHARVALALLETLQRQDLPEEVLVDENLSVTLPRRLGLSHVVDAQVRRYREEARRNRRVPEPEVADLMRLVVRRPDAAQILLDVGRALGAETPAAWRRMLPRTLAPRLAKRRGHGILRDLFGGHVTRSPRGEPALELVHDLFLNVDPGGTGCALLTGVLEGVAQTTGRSPLRVRKLACGAGGAPCCRWVIEAARPELVPLEDASEDTEPGSGVARSETDPGDEALSA